MFQIPIDPHGLAAELATFRERRVRARRRTRLLQALLVVAGLVAAVLLGTSAVELSARVDHGSTAHVSGR